jgi:hypothetical protein
MKSQFGRRSFSVGAKTFLSLEYQTNKKISQKYSYISIEPDYAAMATFCSFG